MTPATCPRSFEVEAARDGRLTGAELTGFERHMRTCSVCLLEARALEAPAAALRSGSAGKRDELHVRRERTRLLASFDEALVVPAPGWRRVWLWSAPVLAALAGFLVFRHMQAAKPVRASSAVVRASSAAAWSEKMDSEIERVRLERGSLWLHVDHSSRQGRKLLLELPDGELEDTGTTFSVSAEGGHTTRVEVQDGSVVLRVRGATPVAIGPGSTWSPSPSSLGSASATSAPTAEPAPSTATPLPSASAVVRPAAGSAEVVAPAILDASDEFRAAMATLDRGDNARAAAALRSFLTKHPSDARTEDAAYLRVVALRRSGDDNSMRRAGTEYLKRYPAGFRRAEVEALLH